MLPKVEWVSGLKGPTLGVRWGVGVQITPDSYKQDLKPVGVTQQLPKVLEEDKPAAVAATVMRRVGQWPRMACPEAALEGTRMLN